MIMMTRMVMLSILMMITMRTIMMIKPAFLHHCFVPSLSHYVPWIDDDFDHTDADDDPYHENANSEVDDDNDDVDDDDDDPSMDDARIPQTAFPKDDEVFNDNHDYIDDAKALVLLNPNCQIYRSFLLIIGGEHKKRERG